MAPSQKQLSGNGLTTDFSVSYEDSLSNQAIVIANANALLAVVENEFNVTTAWFNTPAGKFGTGNRQVVNLNLADTQNPTNIGYPGANNNGYGSAINLDAQNLAGTSAAGAPLVEDVFMAEWVEILMSAGGVWNAGDSNGEGLSQFLSTLRFQNGHYGYYGSFVSNWLDGVASSSNAARSDWVNNTFTGAGSVHGDQDAVSFGCALAFLYYLNVQLGFTPTQIIANFKNNLATAYNNLTGDQGNPFPFFLNLIQSVYPAGTPASIPGPVIDNPFPIALTSFVDNHNIFGKDEAQDIINTQGGLVTGAFWVAVAGFSKDSFLSLGLQVSAFSGTFFNLPGVKISPNPLGPQYENGVNDTTPQTIQIPFDLTLSTPILKQFPSTGAQTYTLSVALLSGGKQVAGSPTTTVFELLAGANPYFSNIDPNQVNLSYLSQDLRVFTATPALNNVPIAGGPALTDSIAGGFTYIQSLLKYLNGNASFTNPNGVDPFTKLLPDQFAEGQDDSSVTPLTADLSHGILNLKLDNNYNFALARVRIRGSAGVAGEASNVKVFFRLFTTVSNDTDYDANGTYAFTPDAKGKPGSPLPGTGGTTIPFFATGNLSANTDYAAGGPNIQVLEIPTGQDSLWWYFGCFINLYDPNNKINNAQVQTLLNGTHHCLVAQIAFDDAPIPQGVSPLSWSQLAQRNMQVTRSDNPGPASAHVIPQTFDCRPSKTLVHLPGEPEPRPDELMIDWGKIPAGAVASLYWPQVLATDVIKMATGLYGANSLTASDPHTLQITVTGGVSYIPIPTGAGQNFAGLFTVDLPTTVHAGEVYNITVRRLSSRKVFLPRQPVPPSTPGSGDVPKSPPSHNQDQNQAQIQTQGPAQALAKTPSKAPPPPRPQNDNQTETHAPPSSDEHGKNQGKVNPPTTGALLDLKNQDTREGQLDWRYVVGTFQVRIPVTTAKKMLPAEETTLAIMKWRLSQMSLSNRWYPVLQRYIGYLSARVDGLGGNGSQVAPSPTGIPVSVYQGLEGGGDDGRGKGEGGEKEYTGKVCEVLFDCHGDFVGFQLCDCCATHSLKSRSRSIGEIALRACREQLLLSVFVNPHCANSISRIVVRR